MAVSQNVKFKDFKRDIDSRITPSVLKIFALHRFVWTAITHSPAGPPILLPYLHEKSAWAHRLKSLSLKLELLHVRTYLSKTLPKT